jgi:outer membrane protein assembly factor BamB
VLFRAGDRQQVVAFTATALVGLDAAGGEELWRFPWETRYGANIATPIALGNWLYISSGYGEGCALVKIESNGGRFEARQAYRNKRMENHYHSSVYFADHFYGFHNDRLTSMEAATGKVRWSRSGYGKGSVLVAAGMLIVLGDAGQLVLAEARPVGFTPRGSCKVCDGETWTVPVVAHGRLYVRDQQEVHCYDVVRP